MKKKRRQTPTDFQKLCIIKLSDYREIRTKVAENTATGALTLAKRKGRSKAG